jgi:starch phosphorylase
VDVWLNNPIAPLEASGTSGMKAAVNGGLNLSVLDGWWAEAYEPREELRNGWGIPPSPDTQGTADRDRQDAVTLYETLQDEVIPLYYARDEKSGLSPQWVAACKRSMASILPEFNNERMLRDYLQLFYVPAARQGRVIAADGHRVARDLAAWKTKVRAAWPGVELRPVRSAAPEVQFGEKVSLEVDVVLNGLAPGDVRVECIVHRALASELEVPIRGFAENRRPQRGVTYIGDEAVLLEVFQPVPADGAPACRYRLEFEPPWAGALVYEVRALPQHPNLTHPYEMGLMRKL